MAQAYGAAPPTRPPAGRHRQNHATRLGVAIVGPNPGARRRLWLGVAAVIDAKNARATGGDNDALGVGGVAWADRQ